MIEYLKKETLEIGDAYRVDARNFDVAIWTGRCFIGMRFKIVEWFLDEEDHYDDGGTVKPIKVLI